MYCIADLHELHLAKTQVSTEAQAIHGQFQVYINCLIRVYTIENKGLNAQSGKQNIAFLLCMHGNSATSVYEATVRIQKRIPLIFPEINWAASSDFGTYRLCEQRRFRRACASAQSRQNLRCSLIQAVSQEKPSDRKPDPWPL